MAGHLSDFLATHTARVADLLGAAGPELGLADHRAPRQFLNAVLVALSADDLGPLSAVFDLDASKPDGVEHRLDAALQSLDALAEATDKIAIDVLDSWGRLDLAQDTHRDLAILVRRLTGSVVVGLTKQLATASTVPPSHNASLSITMHELRRPLTILNSYGQLLSAGMLGKLPDSAQVAIDGIASSTESMIQMVSALAELSRLEDPDDELQFELMPVAEVVDPAYEQVAGEGELRGVDVVREVAAHLQIIADRRRLSLALTNVLSNAVKHSPSGEAVTLRVFADAEAWIHFVVTDRGPGFPPDDAPRLFDKYFRSASERHRREPGSGLGLYIVKTVMDRHGGTVTARSEGHGAEFELVIPPAGGPRG